jgi:anti-sigma B factor antagonist
VDGQAFSASADAGGGQQVGGAMSDAFEFDPDSGILRLQGELTIYQINAVTKAVNALINDESLKAVELSGVSELDCAGLQLLLAIGKSEVHIPILESSPAVKEVLTLTGLQDQMILDAAMKEAP